MLKTLRENFKHLKWILWAVIAVFVIFVFVDWGMGTTRVGGDADWAAQIGKSKITLHDFQQEYRQTEDRYRQMYGKSYTPEVARALNLPAQVINTLIDRRLFRAEAARLGLTVSDAEVTAQVLRMRDGQGRPLFVKDGVFVGEATYRRMLAGAQMTPEGFEAETREQLLMQKLNRFLTESVFVGDDELKSDFEGRTVRAKIAYALVPAVAAGAVTDAEAEAYFKLHAGDFTQPEKRKGRYLLVETAKLRDAIKVSDADVAAEYAANQDSYKRGEEIKARHILYKVDAAVADSDAKAKAKAEAAAKKLRGGADFAALARAESEDTGSKASGGDLGSFGRGRMVKEFEDAAFAAKPGEIVGPVKSPFGYHVIQVQERKAERVEPLSEVAAAIRIRLQEQRAQDEVRRVARELADRLAKIGKPSDDEMRKLVRPGVSFGETEFIGRTDAPSGIGMAPAFNQALFSLEVGRVSDPVSIGRGEALVKLVEIKAAGPATFQEVKGRVIAEVVKRKQDEATVAAAKAAMTAGASLEEIAAKLGAKVETPESFGKSGPVPGLGASQKLIEAVFAAAPGTVGGPVFLADKGAVVFRLVEKTPFDQAAFEKEKGDVRDRIKQQKTGRLLQAMLTRLRTEEKIVINKDVLARFGGQG